jgi:hypothetical protein
MSSHTYVYIGVYIVADQFLEIDRTRRECENGHGEGRVWSHSRPEPFCGECGSRFNTVEYIEKRRMSCYDAAEAFGFDEDTFNNVDRGDKPCIWLGNETVDSLTNGEEYEGEFEINPAVIHGAVVEFAEKYAVPIGLLNKNEVDYAVHFGTVMYNR